MSEHGSQPGLTTFLEARDSQVCHEHFMGMVWFLANSEHPYPCPSSRREAAETLATFAALTEQGRIVISHVPYPSTQVDTAGGVAGGSLICCLEML